MLKVSAQPPYAAVLGTRASALAPVLAELHCRPCSTSAYGDVRVRRGAGRASRVLAVLLRLPRQAPAVATTLSIERSEGVETWSRRFGGARPLRSRQHARDGRLVERIGLLELVFDLEVDHGDLRFRQQRVALSLGPLRLPLPPVLSPRVDAAVASVDDGMHVAVTVAQPLLGLVLAYEGTLRTEAP